jgi:DNA-binding response OmpR family regulator
MGSDKELILLVDDNIANLRAGKNVLSKLFNVFTAPSAEKMFGLLANNKPALILLDVEMPEMTGFEAIKILKSKPETQNIPVIFLTGKTDVENEIEGLKLGAIDYITKPFTPPLLVKRVEAHIMADAYRHILKNKES